MDVCDTPSLHSRTNHSVCQMPPLTECCNLSPHRSSTITVPLDSFPYCSVGMTDTPYQYPTLLHNVMVQDENTEEKHENCAEMNGRLPSLSLLNNAPVTPVPTESIPSYNGNKLKNQTQSSEGLAPTNCRSKVLLGGRGKHVRSADANTCGATFHSKRSC